MKMIDSEENDDSRDEDDEADGINYMRQTTGKIFSSKQKAKKFTFFCSY